MNRPFLRLVLATLVLVLVGLAGGWFLRQRDRDLRQQEASVQAEFATNRQRRAALRLRGKPTPPVAPAPSPAASSSAAAPLSNFARTWRDRDKLRALPEYARFLRCDLRRRTMREYGSLFAELKLSPERLAALKDAIDDMLGTAQDAHELAGQASYGSLSPEYAKLVRPPRDQGRQRVRDFLGPEDYARFERFEKSAGWRNHQQFELAEYLADRGVPALIPDQNRTLTHAYVESLVRMQGGATTGATAVAQARLQNAKFAERAAPALSPPQQAALAAYLDFNRSRGEVLGRLLFPDRPPGSVVVAASIYRP